MTIFEQTDLGPCCEVFPGNPTVLVNGAHNAPAMAQLATTLRRTFEGRRQILLVSIARDKEYGSMIQYLTQTGADRIILTRCPHETAVDPALLAEQWRRHTHAAAEILDEPEVALSRSFQAAGSHGVVVATGSLELAGLVKSTHLALNHPKGQQHS